MQSEGPLLKYEKTNERIQKHVKTRPKRSMRQKHFYQQTRK